MGPGLNDPSIDSLRRLCGKSNTKKWRVAPIVGKKLLIDCD